jgi:hypothetical protein
MICQSCLKSGKDLDRKLLNCSGCEAHCYCSKECQIADWPRHKVQCKETRQLRQRVQNELPADQSCALKDYNKWHGSRISSLACLAVNILTKDRFKTHCVHLTVEYRPELRVRFQLSQQYDVPQIDDFPDVRQRLDEAVQRYEQGPKTPYPMLVFMLVITCSNVPSLSSIVPCAVAENGQSIECEPAAFINAIRRLNSGELKDRNL